MPLFHVSKMILWIACCIDCGFTCPLNALCGQYLQNCWKYKCVTVYLFIIHLCTFIFIALVSILEIYHSLASIHGVTNSFSNLTWKIAISEVKHLVQFNGRPG